MLKRFFNWLLKMENATSFDVDNMEWFFNYRQEEIKMMTLLWILVWVLLAITLLGVAYLVIYAILEF